MTIFIICIVLAVGATFPLWGPYVVDPDAEDRDQR